MSGRSAVTLLLVAMAPAVVAALVRAPTFLVGTLAVVGLCALVLSVLNRWSRENLLAPGSRFTAAATVPRPAPARAPRDLERLQTLVAGRIPTAVGVHQWLRPLLVDITATRLRQTRGLDLADAPAGLVPEPLWGLVRPDRPEPADRNGPGLAPEQLAVLVRQLEAL